MLLPEWFSRRIDEVGVVGAVGAVGFVCVRHGGGETLLDQTAMLDRSPLDHLHEAVYQHSP
jgi:hypothetical protein